jgi:hypothetical protein
LLNRSEGGHQLFKKIQNLASTVLLMILQVAGSEASELSAKALKQGSLHLRAAVRAQLCL